MDFIPTKRNEEYVTPKGTKPTKVVAAAILHDGRIWTGARHSDLIYKAVRDNPDIDPFRITQDEQGFLTDDGRFVSRAAAKAIAWKAGQIREDDDRALLSEHLW